MIIKYYLQDNEKFEKFNRSLAATLRHFLRETRQVLNICFFWLGYTYSEEIHVRKTSTLISLVLGPQRPITTSVTTLLQPSTDKSEPPMIHCIGILHCTLLIIQVFDTNFKQTQGRNIIDCDWWLRFELQLSAFSYFLVKRLLLPILPARRTVAVASTRTFPKLPERYRIPTTRLDFAKIL